MPLKQCRWHSIVSARCCSAPRCRATILHTPSTTLFDLIIDIHSSVYSCRRPGNTVRVCGRTATVPQSHVQMFESCISLQLNNRHNSARCVCVYFMNPSEPKKGKCPPALSLSRARRATCCHRRTVVVRVQHDQFNLRWRCGGGGTGAWRWEWESVRVWSERASHRMSTIPHVHGLFSSLAVFQYYIARPHVHTHATLTQLPCALRGPHTPEATLPTA